jgi:hypothetical protein
MRIILLGILIKISKLWWVFMIGYSLLNAGWCVHISRYSLVARWALEGILAILMLCWVDNIGKFFGV